ncbi:MAG: helix-turn-helix transcriptional regulator [Aeromicrobium sp.]|uniref:helix-turn-helix domain-containing protein n=1 Tax=Aeromicrobium sp. TaxID=1871063 RepID=UPI0039E48304
MAKLTATDSVTGAVKGTVAGTVGGLGEYLREQRRQARLSLRQLAEESDVSNPYLSQIERGLRRPSAEVLQQIAKALRISAESLYVRAGILDADASGPRMVEDAIALDPRLTERQKSSLIDIYRSFVGAADDDQQDQTRDASERTENNTHHVQEDTAP